MSGILCRSFFRTRIFSSRLVNKLSSFKNYSDAAEVTESKPSFVVPSYLKLPPKTNERIKQLYDYFLVLDFEATCESKEKLLPQEIIEFPVILVNGATLETESIFHSYVRPTVHPELSRFCTELTGITQDMLKEELEFEDVFEDFQFWFHKNIPSNAQFIFATCGDWDLKFLFPMQCKGLRIRVPEYMKKWINIKCTFSETAETYPRNLVTMLKFCELQHEGRLHSGLDDCKNIAKVLTNLAERGILLECNGVSN